MSDFSVPLSNPLVPCESSRKEYVHRTTAIGCSDFPVSSLMFTWKAIVKPLMSTGCKLESPTFEVPIPEVVGENIGGKNSTWYLQLDTSSNGYYAVDLVFKGVSDDTQTTASSKFCIVDCRFSVLDSTTSEVVLSSTVSANLCEKVETKNGVKDFIKKADLGKFSLHDVLTVQVDASLVYCTGPIQSTNGTVSLAFSSNIQDGWKKLYDEKCLSDVIIKCGGTEFQCHKFVLASQSPIFSKMLETTCMNDKQEDVLEISDTDSNVMSDLLSFLYTDSAPNLNSLAKDLLYAASKYELPRLMILCENELMLNLYVDNLLETVQHADACGASNLKKACLRMIAANAAKISKLEEWEVFKDKSKELVYEALEL